MFPSKVAFSVAISTFNNAHLSPFKSSLGFMLADKSKGKHSH